ncbi:C-type lectin-like [Sander lucioperca]|uniref:C-type lectin-like n=1 Tax=Sander lucioperca TaxID=283035 RepID=UPI0016538C3D|nr:C-type lectin-like [Sander lucioperca]
MNDDREASGSLRRDGPVYYLSRNRVCTGSNVTFVIVALVLTWTQAQIYCRAHYTDLASVRNSTENQKVQAMLYGGGLFWFGLFRDSWKWSDGSTSSFRFWKNGQPDNNNETCVAADFSQSGAWEDWPCDMERAFICYGPVVSKKVVKVKFENKKNLDLNNAAVMEAMLKQVNHVLYCFTFMKKQMR